MGEHQTGSAQTDAAFALAIADKKEKPALSTGWFLQFCNLVFQVRKMFQSCLLASLFWLLCWGRSRVLAYYHVIANLFFRLLGHQVRLPHAW